MIDLGDELADYGDDPKQPVAGGPADEYTHGRFSTYARGPNGMRTFGKLADLQKGGFNVNPRTGRGIGTPNPSTDDEAWRLANPSLSTRQGFGMRAGSLPDPLTDDSRWTFAGMIDDDSLTIDASTWFGTDDDSPYLPPDLQWPNPFLPIVNGLPVVVAPINGVTDALRRDVPLADIVVPDQPFKWKPNVVASRTFAAKCQHGIAAGTCRRCAK